MSYGVTVDSTGIHAPTYADILMGLKQVFWSIYGADAYLEADSQDGQFLAALASAINDCNATAIAVFNGFSPITAQGDGLSRMVKINGITRAVPSNSTVPLTLIGVAGTTITNGAASDGANTWSLPGTVVIPDGGAITVTATCQAAGAVTAPANTVTQIMTPTKGWQSVTNAAAAQPGSPIEVDAALRARQQQSVALPSKTILAGILGAVQACQGVSQAAIYENFTNITNTLGIPANAISVVAQGGSVSDIVTAIALKKTPGCNTYGTTNGTYFDAYGNATKINYFVAAPVAISVVVTLKALAGYVTTTGTAIQSAIAACINAGAIGGGASGCVEWDSCIAAAKSVSGANTFKVEALTLSSGGVNGSPDVPLAFNQIAVCNVANITITVQP